MEKKIIVCSTSKLKSEIVTAAFRAVFPGTVFSVTTLDLEGEGAEPVGEDQLRSAIVNHMQEARKIESAADFYIAMEGGVRVYEKSVDEISMVIIEDGNGYQSVSLSASFPVPPLVVGKVLNGVPFADAVNETYGTKDVKNTNGFVGLLTDDKVNKFDLYFQPTVIALSKFKKGEWFWGV